MRKCSICGLKYEYGNNAQPINDGECCDRCNAERVLPARIKQHLQAINKTKEGVPSKHTHWSWSTRAAHSDHRAAYKTRRAEGGRMTAADLQLLSKRQVTELLSISKAQLDIWRRKRGFPQPLHIFGVNRWRPAEIEAWVSTNAQLTQRASLACPAVSGHVRANNGKFRKSLSNQPGMSCRIHSKD
jgi:predicted DNA-binding transcriptional regulator AlpA